jgi:hypothetical protein
MSAVNHHQVQMVLWLVIKSVLIAQGVHMLVALIGSEWCLEYLRHHFILSLDFICCFVLVFKSLTQPVSLIVFFFLGFWF